MRPPREVESKEDESANESIFETISTEIQLQPELLNDTAFSNIETETFGACQIKQLESTNKTRKLGVVYIHKIGLGQKWTPKTNAQLKEWYP